MMLEPTMAHCMIRSGALHPCDENKASLQYLSTFDQSCTSRFGMAY